MKNTYDLYPNVKDDKFIDLEEVIKSKNPKLLKILPGFVIKYLKKIIHQEDINSFLKEYGNHKGFDFIDAIVKSFDLKAKVIGKENIPVSGRYIIAANHPIGGPEAILLLNIIREYRIDMKFLVNDILMNIRNLSDLFLPVNKHGSYSKAAALKLDEAFKSKELILTFPYGLVSRRKKGIIQDLEWKRSFITKAKNHKRDIIPIHISGKNSNFFYNLAGFRKAFGIRANIEMLFLVNEMYKHKNEEITYCFGKPVSFESLTSRITDQEWAEKLRQHVYRLPADYKAEFS